MGALANEHGKQHQVRHSISQCQDGKKQPKTRPLPKPCHATSRASRLVAAVCGVVGARPKPRPIGQGPDKERAVLSKPMLITEARPFVASAMASTAIETECLAAINATEGTQAVALIHGKVRHADASFLSRSGRAVVETMPHGAILSAPGWVTDTQAFNAVSMKRTVRAKLLASFGVCVTGGSGAANKPTVRTIKAFMAHALAHHTGAIIVAVFRTHVRLEGPHTL